MTQDYQLETILAHAGINSDEATGALIGTPASIRASVEPQIEPCEVEPLEDNTSETSLNAYGNSSTDGITGSRARSARAP